MTNREQNQLFKRLEEEEKDAKDSNFFLPIHLDLSSATALVGALQVALRNPEMTGVSARIARRFVDGVIDTLRASGYPAHAELAEIGNDPEQDEPLGPVKWRRAGGMQ